jgi:hypothetical protein
MHGANLAVKRHRQLACARRDCKLIKFEAFDVARRIEPAEA